LLADISPILRPASALTAAFVGSDLLLALIECLSVEKASHQIAPAAFYWVVSCLTSVAFLMNVLAGIYLFRIDAGVCFDYHPAQASIQKPCRLRPLSPPERPFLSVWIAVNTLARCVV
jgi:hypothetical protein